MSSLAITGRPGLTAASPSSAFVHACTTAELGAALAEVRARARHHLAAARPLVEAVPAKFLPALLPLAPVPALLDRLEKSDPFRPVDLPQWRRQWLIWRAARRPAAMI